MVFFVIQMSELGLGVFMEVIALWIIFLSQLNHLNSSHEEEVMAERVQHGPKGRVSTHRAESWRLVPTRDSSSWLRLVKVGADLW